MIRWLLQFVALAPQDPYLMTGIFWLMNLSIVGPTVILVRRAILRQLYSEQLIARVLEADQCSR